MAFVTGYTKNVCYNGILGAFQWHPWLPISELLFGNGILGPLQWSCWLLPFQSSCLEIRMQLHTRTMLLWPLQWHLDHCNGILGLPIQSSCNCYGPCHCNSYNFKCLGLEIRDGGTFSSVFSLLNFLCFVGDCVEQQVKVLQVGDKSTKWERDQKLWFWNLWWFENPTHQVKIGTKQKSLNTFTLEQFLSLTSH